VDDDHTVLILEFPGESPSLNDNGQITYRSPPRMDTTTLLRMVNPVVLNAIYFKTVEAFKQTADWIATDSGVTIHSY
jgi:hypothetical protein